MTAETKGGSPNDQSDQNLQTLPFRALFRASGSRRILRNGKPFGGPVDAAALAKGMRFVAPAARTTVFEFVP